MFKLLFIEIMLIRADGARLRDSKFAFPPFGAYLGMHFQCVWCDKRFKACFTERFKKKYDIMRSGILYMSMQVGFEEDML